ESASNTRDSQIVDSQNEDVPEFDLRPFLAVRLRKPSLDAVVPLKSGEFKDPSALGESAQTPPDKSSISCVTIAVPPPPTTQSCTAPNSTRKISTSSTVTEKNNTDSEAVRQKSYIDSSIQNMEQTKSDSQISIPYGGGIEMTPIVSDKMSFACGTTEINEIWNAQPYGADSDNDDLLDEMEETSEYNSDSGDDLPNLNIDRRRIWQRYRRKYKYLNRADCPKSECLYASEMVQPEGWIIRQEYPHCYRYFHNLIEFEKWHELIPENQRTFHEVIRAGQSQKIKIDIDGELAKFASYPDPLARLEAAPRPKTFDGIITNERFHQWQKSTEILRKKDEISLYIKNALQIAIKEITGSDLSMDDILLADSSNESKWSQHLILPHYFVRGAYKARKFTARILELVPQRMHSFIDDKVNKNIHCFRLAGSHKAEDPLRIKRIRSNHTWRESLITLIDNDSTELWPYEWEEDKKLKNESVSREKSDTAIKI
ncbi:10946_t:CDS:2, partial [Paraglomus occultum]